MKSMSEIVEQKWTGLKVNGKLCKGISLNVHPNLPPLWFDKKKFQKSQDLSKKYYGSLSFGQFNGLMIMFNHYEGFAPLTVTGNSANVQKLFRRYFSTIIHVKYWYSNDPFDSNSKAYKSLKHVRGLHRQVSQFMNTKGNRMEGRDRLWISQYDMACAQFAFIGLVALYPKQCGLHSLSDEDFDCLLYFWRVIGYCLGTDDRYNLCSGTPEETVELCGLLYRRVVYPLISADTSVSSDGLEMAKGLCLAMNSISKFINWNISMKYWFRVLGITKTVQLQSFSERFYYFWLKITLNYLTKFSIGHYLLSSCARTNIWITSKFKQYEYNRLAKKYKDISYDYKCPFDINVFEKIKDNECQDLSN